MIAGIIAGLVLLGIAHQIVSLLIFMFIDRSYYGYVDAMIIALKGMALVAGVGVTIFTILFAIAVIGASIGGGFS